MACKINLNCHTESKDIEFSTDQTEKYTKRKKKIKKKIKKNMNRFSARLVTNNI